MGKKAGLANDGTCVKHVPGIRSHAPDPFSSISELVGWCWTSVRILQV